MLYKVEVELIKVLLHLCSAAGYLALKKYHDLQICTRPTCRGILGDGICKKIKVFFSLICKLQNTGFFGKKLNA